MSEGGTLPPVFAVVLAAGKGTRMKSNRAKVLHTLCGVPMVNYVIEAIKPLPPRRLLVVVGHQAELVEAVLPKMPSRYCRRSSLARETQSAWLSEPSARKRRACSSWSTATGRSSRSVPLRDLWRDIARPG